MPLTDRRFRATCGGYTLLEILVVTAIVAILAAVGMPNLLGGIQRYRLRTAANHVATVLRQVQSLAMTSGKKHRFIIVDCTALTSPGTTTCKKYRLEKETWPALTDGWDNAKVLTKWVDLQQDFGGVSIKSLQASNGTDIMDVVFDSRGASTNTSAGPYALTITVTNPANEVRTIQVSNTGRVKVP